MKKILVYIQSQTLKDSFVVMIGLSITAAIGFVYTVVLARVLGPSGFGIYSAISALATIVYSLGDLGISSAIINFLPKKIHARDHVINTSFWLQSMIVVLSFLFFLLIAIFHQYVIPGSIQSDILLAGTLAINYLFIGFAQGVFTAEKRFWSYSFSQIIDSAIKILLVFTIYKLNRLTIGTALASNVVSTFFALVITFWKELLSIKYDISGHVLERVIKFARWIAVSRVFSVLISRIDVLFLNLLTTSYVTGIFSAASRVTLLFALLVSSLGSVVNPRFSGFSDKKTLITYLKKLSLLVSAIALVMILCAWFGPMIIKFVYGAKYLEAIPVFQSMTLAMIPFLYTLVTTPALIYTFGQTAFYAKLIAAQVVTIIGIDLLFIPSLTYFAPVVALAASNLLVLTVSFLKLLQLIHDQKTLDRGQSPHS